MPLTLVPIYACSVLNATKYGDEMNYTLNIEITDERDSVEVNFYYQIFSYDSFLKQIKEFDPKKFFDAFKNIVGYTFLYPKLSVLCQTIDGHIIAYGIVENKFSENPAEYKFRENPVEKFFSIFEEEEAEFSSSFQRALVCRILIKNENNVLPIFFCPATFKAEFLIRIVCDGRDDLTVDVPIFLLNKKVLKLFLNRMYNLWVKGFPLEKNWEDILEGAIQDGNS